MIIISVFIINHPKVHIKLKGLATIQAPMIYSVNIDMIFICLSHKAIIWHPKNSNAPVM